MKQKLHSKAVPCDWAFTNEFSEIADAKSLDPEMIDPITHEPVRKLRPTHDKLAVLYLDGNGFGKLGRQRLKEGLEKFTTWSEGIQSHHNGLLERILDAATRDKEWMNYDKVRLETLLWGGDEIIWVVPAWKGWELVKLVFASAHAINERPVSYSAGLVFCHVKSPIKDIVELAIRLGNTAKAACKDDDRLAYEVLESLDTITSNLDTHRRVWLPGEIRTSESVITPAVDADVLLLDPKQLASAWEHLNALAQSDDLPRRQLYGYCRAWKNHDSAEMARAESRIRQALPNAGLESSLASLGGGPGAWLHLLQILPYLPTAARS